MKSRARVFPCLTSAITCALAGALVAGLAAGGAAQGPGADRPLLVTTDYALLLQAWRAGPSGYEKVWEATPRSADRDFAKRRTEAVAPGRDAPPVMADVDGDGGIPWFVFVDPSTGEGIVTSTDPDRGNVGFPAQDFEIAHFKKMVEKVAQRITPAEIEMLEQSLVAFRDVKLPPR